MSSAPDGAPDLAQLVCYDDFLRIAQARLDPMTAPHPFHGEARITLSPHIGGVTADAYVKMGVAAAKNALAVLNA